MTLRQTHPPWHYLHQASETSLQSYELTRLNHAANLRKEMVALLDQWLEETADAMLARWLLEHQSILHRATDSLQQHLDFDANPLPKAAAKRGTG